MELSERLKAVAGMVTAGNIVCDVGCDHGYVPIYLAGGGISPKVIAMDVNEGPLRRAEEHVKAFGLEEYIVTRLSDGVSALEKGEAETLILAGMGGRLVAKILSEGREKVRAMRELILQPQSDIVMVRRFLRKEGYCIQEEDIVCEDGKYYPVIRALVGQKAGDGRALAEREEIMCGRTDNEEGADSPGGRYSSALWQEACDRYGPCLLKCRHPVLYRYLLWEQGREEAVSRTIAAIGDKRTKRHREREEELAHAACIRQCALDWFCHEG